MTLLTKKIREDLPKLYDNEGKSDAKVIVKFFTPDSNWTWYATEFDGVDTFFGLVDGFARFGYNVVHLFPCVDDPVQVVTTDK